MSSLTDRFAHCRPVRQCIRIILWTGVLFSNGCIADKSPPERITVINNSDRRISFNHGTSYPDTSLSATYNSGCDFIDAHSSCDAKLRLGWSLEFERNAQGIVSFHIADYDTLMKYGGDKLRSEYLILKRYDLTKDSLEKLNWTITYP